MTLTISPHFRDSLGWLHTWLGIGFSALLFIVFWTGSLTVFDKEIDQWMKPELRLTFNPDASLDKLALPFITQLDIKPGSTLWISPPQDRIPTMRFYYTDNEEQSRIALLNPHNGEQIIPTDSDGGEFFFRFHYMLHMPGDIGYYLVAVAALAMLVLIISGVFIHRKIFKEFFTFRPRKNFRRATLDFHNLTSVIALPFHFIIPFSGLLILVISYFPWSFAIPFEGNVDKLYEQLSAYDNPKVLPSNKKGRPVNSLDTFVFQAKNIWQEADINQTSDADGIAIFNFDDENAYIVVERFFANKRVALGPDQIVFDPHTEQVIDQFRPALIHNIANWIKGLHWIQFDHWPLRWLYFLGGLTGCMMIASGLLFWIKSRTDTVRDSSLQARFITSIMVTATTGLILATASLLIANRLLPKTLVLDGIHRHDLEIWIFFAAWLITFFHALFKYKSAWYEQCFITSIVGFTAVILNWITTGDHILVALRGGLTPVASMDITLIIGSLICFYLAIQAHQKNTKHYG
jgi:uncharacterized iron-regulated membrane protein